jgi:hypothetical protein
LTVADLVTGQFSIPRALFERLGGYDEQFNRGGSFGREDTDFGHRLLEGGHRLVFAPDAVSWQVYRVRPAAYLRQWHQAGRADVTYLRKYPDQFEQIYRSRRPNRRWNRLVFRPLARVPVAARLVAAVCRPAVVALVTRRPDDERARRWFFRMRSLEYWRGVQAAGGFPRAEVRLRVLCYHAVRDLSGAAVLSEYGVPATLLERQLRAVRRAGYRFVTTAEVLRWLDGGGLPRRPVLVTFDDGYVDLATEALPVLDAEGVPAVVFAVSALLGGTAWHRHRRPRSDPPTVAVPAAGPARAGNPWRGRRARGAGAAYAASVLLPARRVRRCGLRRGPRCRDGSGVHGAAGPGDAFRCRAFRASAHRGLPA